MRGRGIFDSSQISLDMVAEGLLWVLVAFVPWPFGVVHAWSEWVVALLVGGLALCLVWRVLFDRRSFVWTWALAPLLGLLGMALLSMAPLPVSLVQILSPHGVAIRHDLLTRLPPGQGDSGTMTLSFYALGTAHMARLLICSLIVFAAVVNFCRTAAHVTRLMAVVAVVGGVLAGEAILQNISSNGLIYWTIPSPEGKVASGPFVNYNNFCQFVNLSIGAGLGLLLQLFQKRIFSFRHHPMIGLWHRLEDSERRHAGLLFVMLLLASMSVLFSSSRGGVLSMLAAGGVTTVILLLRREVGVPLKLLSLLGLALVVVLLGLGFESLWARMETLSDLEKASGARWQVFHDVIAFIPQFAFVGTGLGTHEFVYPMFSHLNTWRNAAFVENEYIQLVEEMGVVGVVLVGAFVAVMIRNFVGAIRRTDFGLGYAALGLGYGLVAVLVASITDFGQRLASISCLTAVVCGLIVAIRRIEPEGESSPRRLTQPLALAISAVVLVLVGWMLVGASRAALAEHHWRQVLPVEAAVIRKGWEGTDWQYQSLLENAQAAADWEPGNVEYKTWLGIYRWHQSGRAGVWEALTAQQRSDLLARLVADFQACERLCPTYGLSYCMAGQIRLLGMGDSAGEDEIRKAYKLAPTHRAVCFMMGRLSAIQGKWEDAGTELRRARALNYPSNEILDVYVKTVDRPDKAVEVFSDDWSALETLAQVMEKEPKFADLAGDTRARAQSVLKADAEKPDATVQTVAAMAELLEKRGDLPEAIRYYRRAINGNYSNAEWHFALALMLNKRGETEQARQEATISLRQNAPALSADHRDVAESLSHLSASRP